jgi:hypothetical protein
LREQIVVRRALAGEDGPADVDEREDERRVQPLILGLDVIGRPAVLDVRV